MESAATWAITGITTLTAILGVVFAWPSFSDWHRQRRTEAEPVQNSESTSVLTMMQARRTIRVGCIPFPPLISYSRSAGGAAGLYATAFDDIGIRNGLTIEYVPVRNDDAMRQLNEGKIDLVACLLETPERARDASFTARIHQMAICGVVRRDSTKIKTRADLRRADVRAIVVEGEIGAEVARTHLGMSADNGRLQEIVTNDVSSIFAQVMSRHADVAITDGVTCADYLAGNEDAQDLLMIRFMEDPLWLVPCGLMIKHEDDDSLSRWLDEQVRVSLRAPLAEAANLALLDRYRNLVREM